MKPRYGNRRALLAPVLFTTLIAVLPAPTRGQAVKEPDARGRAAHLLSRATYGARPTDIDTAVALGLDAWLERQLYPETIDDGALAERLSALPSIDMSPTAMIAAYPPPRVLRERLGDVDSMPPTERRRRMRALGVQPQRRIVAELTAARLDRAVRSERQLEAVMTDFWFNHFNVFWGKGPVRWLVADYERNAIRPHVFGRFEDLLVATAGHPAMLVYLDNARSVAPDRVRSGGARAGGPQRRARSSGLNENYARELLELHTLGVDGGYTQDDVVAVARAFTGWTLTPPSGRAWGTFRFARRAHDRQEKAVLGYRLKAGRGIEDGLDVLRILARHPSTAHHIAYKLAEAFIADAPPAGLVADLARVYLATDGDLRAVTKALFTAPEFYDPRFVAAKTQSPFELVVSALRVTGAEMERPQGVFQFLREAGHAPYLETAPTGYPEVASEWINSGAILQRIDFAVALAGGVVPGVSLPRPIASSGGDAVSSALSALLPERDTGRLEAVIRTAIDRHEAPAPGRGTIALILGSPEFQMH